MIQLEQISKTFHDGARSVEALRNVDLEVTRGQIFGVIGGSGAGPSHCSWASRSRLQLLLLRQLPAVLGTTGEIRSRSGSFESTSARTGKRSPSQSA